MATSWTLPLPCTSCPKRRSQPVKSEEKGGSAPRRSHPIPLRSTSCSHPAWHLWPSLPLYPPRRWVAQQTSELPCHSPLAACSTPAISHSSHPSYWAYLVEHRAELLLSPAVRQALPKQQSGSFLNPMGKHPSPHLPGLRYRVLPKVGVTGRDRWVRGSSHPSSRMGASYHL